MRAQAALLLALMIAAPLATAVNDWPQHGFDETHQSRVPTAGDQANVEFEPFLQRWWNNVSVAAKPASPVVFENIVYFGDANGELHAFDRESGGLLWTAETASNAAIRGSPAVAGDSVYVLISSGSIYAFDRKTGTPATGYPISVGGTAQGSVLFHTLQDLIIAAAGANVKSYFANTQTAKWTFSSTGTFYNTTCQGGAIEGTPAVFEDYVFFGSTNKCFYAIDNRAFGTISASGSDSNKPIWVFQAENSIRSSPAVDKENRRVIFGDQSGNIYSIQISRQGKVFSQPWYTEPLKEGLSSEFKAGPAISSPNVIVASRNGNVNALSLSNGAKQWTRSLGTVQIEGTPSVANGKILIGTFGGTMYMLNAENGDILDQRSALKEISGNAIISGTQGIWASDDGALHSYGGEKPARADLAVVSLGPSSMTNGQSSTISGTIRNQGQLDAPATLVSITVGGQQISKQSVPALAVDQSDSFRVSYTPSRTGPLTLTAFVDPGRQIQESDESNNVRTVEATVSNPPPPDEDGDAGSTEKTPGPSAALTLSVVALFALALARRRRVR